MKKLKVSVSVIGLFLFLSIQAFGANLINATQTTTHIINAPMIKTTLTSQQASAILNAPSIFHVKIKVVVQNKDGSITPDCKTLAANVPLTVMDMQTLKQYQGKTDVNGEWVLALTVPHEYAAMNNNNYVYKVLSLTGYFPLDKYNLAKGGWLLSPCASFGSIESIQSQMQNPNTQTPSTGATIVVIKR